MSLSRAWPDAVSARMECERFLGAGLCQEALDWFANVDAHMAWHAESAAWRELLSALSSLENLLRSATRKMRAQVVSTRHADFAKMLAFWIEEGRRLIGLSKQLEPGEPPERSATYRTSA